MNIETFRMNSPELSPLENFAKELFEVRERAWPCQDNWEKISHDLRAGWYAVAQHVLNLQANERSKDPCDVLNRLHDLRVMSQDVRRVSEKGRLWQVAVHLARAENELTEAIARVNQLEETTSTIPQHGQNNTPGT